MFATNGYGGPASPALRRRFVPIGSYAIATEPLRPDQCNAILPKRRMAGLAILKATHNLSDEVLCERWVENPQLPVLLRRGVLPAPPAFDRSSLTRWRQRMGEDKLNALIQENLATALRLEAAKPADFKAVIVDTTVQEKAIAFPTDAKLMQRARERLAKLRLSCR